MTQIINLEGAIEEIREAFQPVEIAKVKIVKII